MLRAASRLTRTFSHIKFAITKTDSHIPSPTSSLLSTQASNMATFSMNDLASACLDLSLIAAAKIKDIVINKVDLQIIDKGDDESNPKALDPTTIADLTAERIIAGSLRKSFPGLNVIGEEDIEDVGPEFIHSPNFQLLSKSMGELGTMPTAWKDTKVEDVCVFVDPLDGTKEFTEGIHSAVTVLVGVSIGGTPAFGVVLQPFYENESQRCFFGAPSAGAYVCQYNGGVETATEWSKVTATSTSEASMVVGTTRSHGRPEIESAIKISKATDVHRVGGAGNKALLIIEGKIDCYLFPVVGTKRWDTCAPQAILEAVGGVMTDKNGNNYNYSSDRAVVKNLLGVVACLDKAKHKTFVAACAE